jgi:integrase
MAISTGLRQGELIGLKWSDIDWRNRHLQVQRQLQRLKEGIGFTEPKSDAGKRTIVLGKAMMEKLRKHIEIQDLEKSLAGSRWQENDLIFSSTIGTPFEPRNLFRIYKELLKQASLPDIRFHDLRHTAATLMFKQGVHPKVVQERLGHSDIALTLNTYSHVLPSMQDDAADLLDELLVPIKIDSDMKASSENEEKKHPQKLES